MKKVLILCVALPIIFIVLYYGNRYTKNRMSTIPYPFYFSSEFQSTKVDAPILIIGDRMGERLATFKEQLARKISTNLSSNIKIQTLTGVGLNSHRVFHAIKNLEGLPIIIIYFGNTDESYESLFYSQDREKILANLATYQNINLQSLLMIYPSLSKLIYKNVTYQQLTPEITPNEESYEDQVLLKRKQIHLSLFAATLDKMFHYTKKRTSVMIPITTPLNLKIPPKKSCYGSIDREGALDLKNIAELLNKKDYKSAFNLSKELVLLYPNNAEALYYHSITLAKLLRHNESHYYGEKAISLDCSNQRGDPIYNEILKKMAEKHNIVSFDFHKYLADESSRNYVFIDDIYPQDFYMEKLTDILAIKIQKLLKLNQ